MRKCEACASSFNKTQGLSGHRLHCKVAKAVAATQEEEAMRKKDNMRILSGAIVEKEPKYARAKPRALEKGAALANSTGGTSSIANDNEDPDSQKANRSSSSRKKHANLEKE